VLWMRGTFQTTEGRRSETITESPTSPVLGRRGQRYNRKKEGEQMKLEKNTLRIKTPSKKDMQHILDGIVRDIATDQETPDKRIVELVAYAVERFSYHPAATKGKGINWVLQAISSDESREVLTYAYYDKEHDVTVGCDGRRAHIADGYLFDVKGKTFFNGKDYQEEDFTYPRYRQVIPYHDSTTKLRSLEEAEKLTTGKDATSNYTATLADGKTFTTRFNNRFLTDALNGTEGAVYYMADELSPLLIETEGRVAVIMPHRIG